MGKILIIKGANFSVNKIDNVTPTPEPTWEEISLTVWNNVRPGGWDGSISSGTSVFTVYAPIDVEGYSLICNNERTGIVGNNVGILFYSAMPTVGSNQGIVTGVQHQSDKITGFSEDDPAIIPTGTKYAVFVVDGGGLTKAMVATD